MYYVIEKGPYAKTAALLAGPFITEKEAQTARRTYCLEVHGRQSYCRQTRTWVTSQKPSVPPVIS